MHASACTSYMRTFLFVNLFGMTTKMLKSKMGNQVYFVDWIMVTLSKYHTRNFMTPDYILATVCNMYTTFYQQSTQTSVRMYSDDSKVFRFVICRFRLRSDGSWRLQNQRSPAGHSQHVQAELSLGTESSGAFYLCLHSNLLCFQVPSGELWIKHWGNPSQKWMTLSKDSFENF